MQAQLAAMPDSSAQNIQNLEEQRKALKRERDQPRLLCPAILFSAIRCREIVKDLKNERRKRKRLLAKVARCTYEELVEAARIKLDRETRAAAPAGSSD